MAELDPDPEVISITAASEPQWLNCSVSTVYESLARAKTDEATPNDIELAKCLVGPGKRMRFARRRLLRYLAGETIEIPVGFRVPA